MPDTLRTLQQTWARHIRDPRQPAPAGVAADRLALYRTLCIGGVEGVLGGVFPRLQAALGETRWQKTVDVFYAGHRCATPLYPELGGEFLDWLLNETTDALQPAWAAELAHFEWTQQQLLMSDATAPAPFPVTADTPLSLSPLARVCGYRWPVDRPLIAETTTAAPTLLLLRRDNTQRLRITRLPAFDYQLLQKLAHQPLCARELLAAMAGECEQPDPALFRHGRHLLRRLRAHGVVTALAHTPFTPSILTEKHHAPQ